MYWIKTVQMSNDPKDTVAILMQGTGNLGAKPDMLGAFATEEDAAAQIAAIVSKIGFPIVTAVSYYKEDGTFIGKKVGPGGPADGTSLNEELTPLERSV